MAVPPNNFSKIMGALIQMVGASTLKQMVNHFGKLIAITINEFIFRIARSGDDDLYHECPQCKKRFFYSAYRGLFSDLRLCPKCGCPLDVPEYILEKEKQDMKNVSIS